MEKENFKKQIASALVIAVEETLLEYGLVTKKQIDDKRAERIK